MLISHKYKKIGWLMLGLSLVAYLFLVSSDYDLAPIQARVLSIFPVDNQAYFSIISVNLSNTLVGMLFIIGGLLVGFSKAKQEDEYIASLRLSSLLWAVLLNYVLLLFAFAFVYDLAFFTVMVYNMFTVLIIFIGRFNYLLFKNTSKQGHAE